MKKSVIAILMTAIILASLMAPLISTVRADEADWYTSVNGVLGTDAYSLYPYTKQSVNVGFSKFGELIGLPAGVDPDTATQADWVGLEYGTRDPFCPPTVIPMLSWINGWYIDLQYIDPALTGAQRDRHLFAFALFGDGFGWGGDWKYAATPGSEPGFGRKTNGQCVTDPLTVLYNGPREYIAMSVTHISDKQGTATWPVVDLAITMVFNKVKKEVVLYKDVKLKLPKMHLWGKLDVQLSNREEYDLGVAPGYSSYAHFYEDGGVTSYTDDWHMTDLLLRENIEHLIGTGGTLFALSPPGGADIAQDFIKVWVDGVFKDPSTYTVNWVAQTITFSAPVGSVLFPADIEVHYKYVLQDGWSTYDIAQVISSDVDAYFGYGNYVAWTAMWPPVSDYTVDGILRYLDPLVGIAEADMSSEPKQSPLIIGEWDFLMDHTDIPQYRCVEVKGITDNRMNGMYQTADDEDMGMFHYNTIGEEVQYQLDEVFNPWDLRDAVHKQTYRWVDISTSPTPDGTTYVGLEDGLFSDPYILYGTAAWSYARAYPPKYWSVYLAPTGTTDSALRILYNRPLSTLYSDASTFLNFMNYHSLGPTGNDPYFVIRLDWDINGVADAFLVSAGSQPDTYPAATWVQQSPKPYDPVADTGGWRYIDNTVGGIRPVASGTPSGYNSLLYWTNAIAAAWSDVTVLHVAVQYDTAYVGSASYVDDVHIRDLTYNLEDGKLMPTAWDQYCAFSEKVTVGSTLIPRYPYQSVYAMNYYTINFVTGLIDFYEFDLDTFTYIPWEIPAGTRIKVLYSTGAHEYDIPHGTYEWITVGRDSENVDAAGASLVSEAFDSFKAIHIGIAGADIDTAVAANAMPFVMSKWGGTGNTWADYYKSGTDYRTALKDDWCTYWPVASSNMIGVGGPLANMLSYYGNDFTTALYGLPQFSGTAYLSKITGVSCWNRGWAGTFNTYASSASAGYAVISTYKDINGTVIFLVWGHWGRDTYYATQWLHGDDARGIDPGIIQLQDAPPGTTSIVLKINFAYPNDATHPAFSIVECLGTISETLWTHGTFPFYEYKGGIHDP